MSNSEASRESFPIPAAVPLTQTSSTLSALPTCSTTRRPFHWRGSRKVVR